MNPQVASEQEKRTHTLAHKNGPQVEPEWMNQNKSRYLYGVDLALGGDRLQSYWRKTEEHQGRHAAFKRMRKKLPERRVTSSEMFVLCVSQRVSVRFALCVGLHACRNWLLPQRWSATLQNNKGILYVAFRGLRSRSEIPQTPNKFKSAEHTRYKASGDTSSLMVVNWEKTRITCQLWPNDDSPFSPFFIQKL